MAAGQRNTAYGVVALIGLATAGVLLYNYATTPKDESPIPLTYNVQAVCLSCSKPANLTRGVTDVQPFECPACSKKAVFSWYYCYGCSKRFVPQPEVVEGQQARLPVRVTCPSCGSENVSAVSPADPTQKPSGDLPLPKWPPVPTNNLPTTEPAAETPKEGG